MENLNCIKKMLVILAFGCCALFAQTRTFYFLPPNDDKWIAGNSYLYSVDSSKATLMPIDTARCGWLRITFSTLDRVPANALIYLGAQGKDKIDINGKGADVSKQAWIPLRTRFGTANTLTLNAETMTFTSTVPTSAEADRCSYKMAAFIYDTDNSVNPSFKGTYSDPGANNNGIRRGIVAPTLDSATRKPIFASAKANWTGAASFNAAFNSKALLNGKVSNIPRCYDMPFGRVGTANGSNWEFDSDKMRTPNNTNIVGGFFPYILDTTYIRDTVDYSDCPTCKNKYNATCFSRLNPANVPAVTYKGINYTGLDAFDRTNFPEGASHHNYYSGNGCTTLRPGTPGTLAENRANLSFCFESHGEFIYEKGQEFFFRGDDDIWVFINDKLVIDLGGTHMPAPGYVDLDSIGRNWDAQGRPVAGRAATKDTLIEGESYPIDIFFCERLATQSNVRVSTNMYITQKTTFYAKPTKPDQPLCVTVSTGGSCTERLDNPTGNKPVKLCGTDLTDRYSLEFYMIARDKDKDTIWLSSTTNKAYCQGNTKNFNCYSDLTDPNFGSTDLGINVEDAVYKCGGRGQCKGNDAAAAKVKFPTEYGTSVTVYARLVKKNGEIEGKPITIDQINKTANPRIVWGNLNNQNKSTILTDSYGATTKREQTIIAGKLTPIYIASGGWMDTITYATFNYYNDQQSIGGIKYSLDGAAELNVVYIDGNGIEQKPDFPRSLPASGIDTLWLRGDYDLGEKTFSINVAGVSDNVETPSLKLTIYQPKLVFKDSTYKLSADPTSGRSFGHGYTGFGWLGTEGGNLPYVGNQLDVYVVAWDSLRNELCSHCSFRLKESSFTNNDSINTVNNVIVESNATRIDKGQARILIRGRDEVKDTSYATWRVYGPSEGITFAVWDSLQFRQTLIPAPIESYIYDRNGDGIGDSLIILFSKSFKEDGVISGSLLPILLGVLWDKEGKDTVYFHHPDYTSIKDLKDTNYVYGLYTTPGFYERNVAYWSQFIPPGRDSILIIAEPTTAFSKDILTYGKGSLLSYTPYNDKGYCIGEFCPRTAFRYPLSNSSVFDRISPIVVKADYTMLDDEPKVCADILGYGCKESLIAYLSEPVFADTNATPFLVKNPFSYCFGYSQPEITCLPPGTVAERSNQNWSSLGWMWELPQVKKLADSATTTIYKPSKKYYPQGNQNDSTVDIVYNADRDARMPKATDWIKIRCDTDVFRDAEGNGCNKREIGVLISGTNVNRKEQVKIAVIDPAIPPEDPRSILGGTFAGYRDGEPYYPDWFSKEAIDSANKYLFNPGNVTEFLPLPKEPSKFTNPDTIKAYYPGSVGTLFEVGHSIYQTADRVMSECTKNYTVRNACYNKQGLPLTADNLAEGITLNANVYYHTNIGNYTAHREKISTSCTSKIFQGMNPLNPQYGNNCIGNEYNFYLAWDLKTNKNRYVGVGAYVAISKVYVLLEYINADGIEVAEKIYKTEAIQMFGVRREKGK
jgi:fibro-slime domain-containing protein